MKGLRYNFSKVCIFLFENKFGKFSDAAEKKSYRFVKQLLKFKIKT